MLSVPADFDGSGAEESVPVCLSAFTNVEDWFSFHEDHSAHEEQDQAVLEILWSRLHAAMPELGDSVEVIETATPQTFYEEHSPKVRHDRPAQLECSQPRNNAIPECLCGQRHCCAEFRPQRRRPGRTQRGQPNPSGLKNLNLRRDILVV